MRSTAIKSGYFCIKIHDPSAPLHWPKVDIMLLSIGYSSRRCSKISIAIVTGASPLPSSDTEVFQYGLSLGHCVTSMKKSRLFGPARYSIVYCRWANCRVLSSPLSPFPWNQTTSGYFLPGTISGGQRNRNRINSSSYRPPV